MIEEKGGVPNFQETRSMLKKLAMAHGADTPVGRACHNLLEMTENYAKSDAQHQRDFLTAMIQREKTRLNELVGQAH